MRYRNWQIFYVPIITGLLQDFFPTAFTVFSKEMMVSMYVNKNDLGNLQNLNQILHIFFCQKVRFPDPVQLFRIHIDLAELLDPDPKHSNPKGVRYFLTYYLLPER